MSKKNQSNRLANQHKQSQGVVGIFGDDAKSHGGLKSEVQHRWLIFNEW